ncbi:MAG: heme exporter protein CcmB [Promethearchaeota archaeon]|jgi:heme exporter protein B
MKKEKISSKSKLKLLKAILSKDIRSELRQINDLVSIFLFAIVSIFIFSSVYIFSTENQNMDLDIYVIENWLVIFFTLIYIMTKLFVKEKESGTLGGLISAPVSSNIIIISKTLYCLILLSFVEIILFITSMFLSAPSINNLSSTQLLRFIFFGVFLPTIDLSVCGSLVSAFSMYAKNKSFVLPILLFPLILPITIPIISINIKILEGAIVGELFYEIIFLVAHTILMISILSLISHTLLYD